MKKRTNATASSSTTTTSTTNQPTKAIGSKRQSDHGVHNNQLLSLRFYCAGGSISPSTESLMSTFFSISITHINQQIANKPTPFTTNYKHTTISNDSELAIGGYSGRFGRCYQKLSTLQASSTDRSTTTHNNQPNSRVE